MVRVRIRLARSGDYRALAELRYRFRAEDELVTETKSRFVRRCTSWMKKRFRAGSCPWRCWVFDDGKRLVGHVCVQLFEKIPNPVNEPELDDLFVANVVAIEGISGGKHEPGNNHATKIEHETVRISHDRHVTGRAAGRAKKADDLVFPRASSELDHVLRRGGDIIIVYWRRDQNPIRGFNCGA